MAGTDPDAHRGAALGTVLREVRAHPERRGQSDRRHPRRTDPGSPREQLEDRSERRRTESGGPTGQHPLRPPAAGSDRSKPETATSGPRSTRSPKNGLTKTAPGPAPHPIRDPAGSPTEGPTEEPSRGPDREGQSTSRRQDEAGNSRRRTKTRAQASSRTAPAATDRSHKNAFPKSGGSAEVEPTGTGERGRQSAPRTTTGRQRRDPNREERAAKRQGQPSGS